MLFIFNLDNKTKTFTCLQNYLYQKYIRRLFCGEFKRNIDRHGLLYLMWIMHNKCFTGPFIFLIIRFQAPQPFQFLIYVAFTFSWLYSLHYLYKIFYWTFRSLTCFLLSRFARNRNNCLSCIDLRMMS